MSTTALARDPQPERGENWADKTSVTAEKFMIAAAHPMAVEAGHQILAAGGSAADAMIATQAMLNLVEPQSSGIGGGAFLLYWDAESRSLITLDGRERAPLAATPERFLEADGTKMGFKKAVIGGQSVGVPGTLKLMELAHDLFGKSDWETLFQPAIEAAESGFEVTPRLAQSIAAAQARDFPLDRFEAAKNYFFNADGSALNAGHLLKNPDFAATLKAIASQGADYFYTGALAQDIVDAVSATSIVKNNITLQDLAAYRVKVRQPVCLPYRDYRVCGMGPPTSGGLTVGQILGMLSHYDVAAMGPGADFAHLYAEASKLAYADRALYMADADYVAMPTKGLLDPDYLAERVKLIDPEKSNGPATAGTPPQKQAWLGAPSQALERPGTSHIVIRDAYGNALSMTTTIETGFGSRVFTNGFLLNNELTDFDRQPVQDGRAVANRVEGGKRPRSSMSPTIVFKDDAPYLLIGSPGGSRIIHYVAKSIIAILDWQMDPQDALESGHFLHRNGKTLDLEEHTEAAALADALTAKGHTVEIRNLNSGLHAILIKEDELIGAADPRREGIARGE